MQNSFHVLRLQLAARLIEAIRFCPSVSYNETGSKKVPYTADLFDFCRTMSDVTNLATVDPLNKTGNWVLLLIKSSAGPPLFVVGTGESTALPQPTLNDTGSTKAATTIMQTKSPLLRRGAGFEWLRQAVKACHRSKAALPEIRDWKYQEEPFPPHCRRPID